MREVAFEADSLEIAPDEMTSIGIMIEDFRGCPFGMQHKPASLNWTSRGARTSREVLRRAFGLSCRRHGALGHASEKSRSVSWRRNLAE